MSGPVFEISKRARFDAAHRLPAAAGADPAYGRLHGHSFAVEATLRGEAQAEGWVEDLGALAEALAVAAGELDHSLLNDHPGLENPTLEALCGHFARRLAAAFPNLRRIAVARPAAGERCTLEL